MTTMSGMRAVNIKELKARLSGYVRAAHDGEIFAVTDRGRVVARLGPADFGAPEIPDPRSSAARLIALGARPPTRSRRPGDYHRTGGPIGLSTEAIDALLDEARGDSR